MNDKSCIGFLQWALPHLHMRWQGFRKVRGQVCKRIGRRLEELHLPNLQSYQMYLEDNPLEWHILDSMCRITISRFYRDKGVFDSLGSEIFPVLIKTARQKGETALTCWSIGSASGEEPFSVSLLWDLSGLENQGLNLNILGTEVDQHMINRAQKGCYPASSVRELNHEVLAAAFQHKDDHFCLKEKYKKRVQFQQQDIRNTLPDSTFQLIFCRNLVFTYFSPELQEEIGRKIIQRLKPGGCLIIGTHEEFPERVEPLVSCFPAKPIYRREE